jgi:hypothetical protein
MSGAGIEFIYKLRLFILQTIHDFTPISTELRTENLYYRSGGRLYWQVRANQQYLPLITNDIFRHTHVLKLNPLVP